MRNINARCVIGDRVATPNGFVAEIVSLTRDKRVIVRYLSIPPGPGETELPLRMLQPATAHDLDLAGIKRES